MVHASEDMKAAYGNFDDTDAEDFDPFEHYQEYAEWQDDEGSLGYEDEGGHWVSTESAGYVKPVDDGIDDPFADN